MLDFLSNLFNKKKEYTGAILEDRLSDGYIESHKNDIKFQEIVGAANVVNWREKPRSEWRSFLEYDQYQSFTCGANALAKSLGIMFAQTYGSYIEFCREDIYQRRINKGYPGMVFWDMFDIASKGVTLAAFMKKVSKTDEEYDRAPIENWMRDIGEKFSAGLKSVMLPSKDIDTIASVIQTTGKAPIMLTFFTSQEWSREFPVIKNPYMAAGDAYALRHFVAIVDFTLIDGRKHLVIEDSAHFGGIARRVIDEAWLAKRGYEIRYPMNFKYTEKAGGRPVYDGQLIVSAQTCLRYEGFFPTNVSYLENVGPVTRAALQKFQKAHSIPVTGLIDDATKNTLHQLYP